MGHARLGNNLFGIQADASWHGPTVSFRTTEHSNGTDVHPISKFRRYSSWLESMEDYARFLLTNPRYTACRKETTGAGWARAVATAGYATDLKYADKLVSIIRDRNLCFYDLVTA